MPANDNKPYGQQRFLVISLDPIHVGTGGYRLGRVDLSIVREPGTNLPKIPGTSLNGAIRQYAAYRRGGRDALKCAGQKDHCGLPTCPICYTFGSLQTRGENGETVPHSGVVNLSDARLMLFPVHSMDGPVWVTCPATLAAVDITAAVSDSQKAVMASGLQKCKNLNLGWLMLGKDDQTFTWPQGNPAALLDAKVKDRTVVVADGLFGQIVNSNLEVRTSVSIKPETGAAEPGALFTYEAIPRAAILWFDVIQDDFRGKFAQCEGRDKLDKAQKPVDVVRAGLKLAQMLGIGGMGTRGFGRLQLLSDWDVTPEGV